MSKVTYGRTKNPSWQTGKLLTVCTVIMGLPNTFTKIYLIVMGLSRQPYYFIPVHTHTAEVSYCMAYKRTRLSLVPLEREGSYLIFDNEGTYILLIIKHDSWIDITSHSDITL
jgi:hypothetical protein